MDPGSTPRVSVVIPSRGRPTLVCRAVRSALGQDLQSIEVIVVLDGPDEVSVKELSQIADPRLRVLVLPQNMGPSSARNRGVQSARAPWIAFLDDDDEWLPAKLKRQLSAAERSSHAIPIVACRVILRTLAGDRILPERLPSPSEPPSEYLLLHRSRSVGDTLLQTSTLLASADLLRRVPQNEALWHYEEWDWMLRASSMRGVALEYLPEALAIWHADSGLPRLSDTIDWRYTFDWFRSVRPLVTQRAYASFLLTSLSQWARVQGDRRACGRLWWEATSRGQPRAKDILIHIGRWLIPEHIRRRLRSSAGPR